MDDIALLVRDGDNTDLPFIASTWLNEAHEPFPMSRVAWRIYKHEQGKLISDIVSRSSCLVAHFPDDANLIAGYIVFERTPDTLTIHWAHSRSGIRGQGVMSRLLSDAAPNWRNDLIIVSHIGSSFPSLAKHFSNLRYNPFAAHKAI